MSKSVHLSALSFVRGGIYLLLLSPLISYKGFVFAMLFTKDVFIMGVTLITLLAFVWLLYTEPQRWQGVDLIGKLLFLYIGVLALASLFGVDPLLSFFSDMDRNVGVIMWVHIALIYIMVRTVFSKKEDWSGLFQISMLVALVSAFFHLISLGGSEFIQDANGGSTLGNSSFYGVYLLFQLFISLLYIAQSKERSRKIFGVITFSVLTITLLLTSAYAATFSFFGGMVLLIGLLLSAQKKKSYRYSGIFIIAALTIGFFASSYLVFQPDNVIHDRFVDLASETRFAVWDIAWEGFKQRPLLGWGVESFETVFLQNYNPCFGSVACEQHLWFDRAHNKILDVLIESGLVGLMAYLSIFIATGLALMRSLNGQKQQAIVASIITAALAAYVVQNLTVFDISVSLLFWVLILGYVGSLTERSGAKPIPRLALAVTAVLIPFALFAFVLEPMRGNAATVSTNIATTLSDRLEAFVVAGTVSANGIDFRRGHLALETAVFLWNNEATLDQITEHAIEELHLGQGYLIETIERTDNPLRAMINLALLYQTEARYFDESKFEDAEALLHTAIELNLKNPQPYWALTSVYLDQGEYEKALALTQEVIDRDSAVDESHLYRLIALRFVGDQEQTDQLVTQSLLEHPNLEKRFQTFLDADIEASGDAMIFQFYMTQ